MRVCSRRNDRLVSWRSDRNAYFIRSRVVVTAIACEICVVPTLLAGRKWLSIDLLRAIKVNQVAATSIMVHLSEFISLVGAHELSALINY